MLLSNAETPLLPLQSMTVKFSTNFLTNCLAITTCQLISLSHQLKLSKLKNPCQSLKGIDGDQFRPVCPAKSFSERDPYSQTGETARSERGDNAVGAPFFGQSGDHRHQPFRMAAPEHAVVMRKQLCPLEQGDRAGFAGGFDGENAHGCSPLPQRDGAGKSDAENHTIVLNVSKSGRGERSKILAGSP